jgi:hypothetical protein
MPSNSGDDESILALLSARNLNLLFLLLWLLAVAVGVVLVLGWVKATHGVQEGTSSSGAADVC